MLFIALMNVIVLNVVTLSVIKQCFGDTTTILLMNLLKATLLIMTILTALETDEISFNDIAYN
jgi:hypothetical protein